MELIKEINQTNKQLWRLYNKVEDNIDRIDINPLDFSSIIYFKDGKFHSLDSNFKIITKGWVK